MSYRCDKCNCVRYGKELTRSDEIRNVTYNRMFKSFNRKERKEVSIFNEAFKGTEIVKQERLCEKCFEEVKDLPPKTSIKDKTVEFFVKKPKREYGNSNKPDVKGLSEKFNNRDSFNKKKQYKKQERD